METFAYIETAVAHENPHPEAQLRSFKELGLTVPNSAWLGIAALLLSASMLVVQVPQAQAFPATVAASSGVNVRSGPGTNYPIISGLSNGTRVNVISTSGGWYQISSGGWIASNFTSTSGTGGGGTPVSGSVTTTAGVNIRSGPSTSFAIIGGLGSGSTVRVISLSNGFYQLASGGWISANFTSRPGTGGGGTPVSGSVTASADLNIRSGPSTSFAIIGGLPRGSTVRVVSLSNGYYQLASGGWIFANFTTRPGTGGGGIPGTSGRVATNGSPLLIRSSPGGGVIGSLSNGSSVRLSGRFSGGYAQLANGGWVSTSWLIY